MNSLFEVLVPSEDIIFTGGFNNPAGPLLPSIRDCGDFCQSEECPFNQAFVSFLR